MADQSRGTAALGSSWTQWVIFLTAALACSGALYATVGVKGPTVECIGTQQIALAKVSNDAVIVTLPNSGFEPYAVKVGPMCADLEISENAFSKENLRQICVGNDIKLFGGTSGLSSSDDECKILSIQKISAGQAANLLDVNRK